MSLRYHDFRWCDRCGRGTPWTRRGCAVCGARLRKAKRLAKSCSIGNPFVRRGELLKISDDLFSAWARASVEACRMCLAPLPPERLQWAHHFTREIQGLRYNDDNWSVLCRHCHWMHTPADRPEWRAWLRDVRLGPEKFDVLEAHAKTYGKGNKLRIEDLDLQILVTQHRIGDLAPGPRKEWALEKARVITERYVRMGVRVAG